MNAPDSHDAVGIDVRWTDEASKRLKRAPLFLRGMVRRVAEKKLEKLGCGDYGGASRSVQEPNDGWDGR